MRRILRPPQPLDVRRTLRGVPGATTRPGEAYWATRTPLGPATLRLTPAGGELVAEAWGPGATWVLEQAPHLLGVGDAPESFVPQHPVLRRLHRSMRGMRFARTGRVFDALLPGVLGQKVTGRESGRSLRQLVGRFGEPAPGPVELMLPPSPETIASLPYHAFHPLGVERRRADVLRAVAARASRLEEITTMDSAQAHRRLTALRGVGPWTAAGVVAVALGDADAVLVGDYHLPHLVSWALAGEPRGDDRRMLQLLEPYRGHRGRVIRLLKYGGISAPRYGPRYPIRDFAAS